MVAKSVPQKQVRTKIFHENVLLEKFSWLQNEFLENRFIQNLFMKKFLVENFL